MAPAKAMHGARALVQIMDNNNGGAAVTVGIFNSINYGLQYDVQPIFVLGRYTGIESVYTGAEPVAVSVSGFRIIDLGPHVAGRVPHLQALLNHEYINLVVQDRQTGKTICTIRDCRPTGYSTALSARSVEEITISYLGLMVEDESGENTEGGGVLDPITVLA
jgi:hypothetical protein